MAEIKNISVVTIGNPDGSSGVGEIALYNNPQFKLTHDIHPGLDGNSYYFSIKIESNYTIYKIIKNNVRSNAAIRGGYLAIAFSIPRGYELSSSNPYQVLLRLWESFQNSCMNLKDAQLEVYEFNSKQVNPAALDNIASSIVLRQVKRPYRPMNKQRGIALVVQPDDKIEELLSDVQYPEFSDFSEILVAKSVDSIERYTLLKNLTIPRPCSYKLIIDGNEDRIITNIKENITIETKEDPRCYNNDTKSFTIKGLLDGTEKINGVEVDEENEEINVSTKGWATPKVKKIHVSIVPDEANTFFLKNTKLLIVKTDHGHQIALDETLSFKLVGPEILYQYSVEATDSSKFKLRKAEHVDNNEIKITADKVSGPKPPQMGIKQGKQQEQKGNDVVRVRILIDSNIEENFGSRRSLMVCLEDEQEERKVLILKTLVVLAKQPKNLEGVIFVPRTWNTKRIYASFQTKEYKYTSKSPLDLRKNECDIKDFDSKKKGIIHNRRMLWSSFFIGLFIIGFFCGFGTHSVLSNKASSDSTQTDQDSLSENDGIVDANQEDSIQMKNDAEKFLSSVKDSLEKKDVTFSCIHNMYKSYLNHCYSYEAYDQEHKVFEKLKAYDTLATAIELGKVSEAKDLANDSNISSQHQKQVRKLKGQDNHITRFTEIQAPADEPEASRPHSSSSMRYYCHTCKPDGSLWFDTEEELKDHERTEQHLKNEAKKRR